MAGATEEAEALEREHGIVREETGARWGLIWEIILGDWDRITANDLHQHFGIDVDDGSTMLRPWWWLRGRILGILDIPESRLIRAIAAREVAAAKADETRTG